MILLSNQLLKEIDLYRWTVPVDLVHSFYPLKRIIKSDRLCSLKLIKWYDNEGKSDSDGDDDDEQIRLGI